MNTIPLWVPLVVAALGVVGTIVGTIAGVMITQRRSDRREDLAWTRERQREHEQWAREDLLRTFEQKRDAYIDFYESLRAMALRAYDHGMGLSEPEEMPFEWNLPTAKKLDHLRIYAVPDVMASASEAYDACWWWGHLSTHGNDDEKFYDRQDVYNDAELILFEGIRRDLGVPTTDVEGPLPGSGWVMVERPPDVPDTGPSDPS